MSVVEEMARAIQASFASPVRRRMDGEMWERHEPEARAAAAVVAKRLREARKINGHNPERCGCAECDVLSELEAGK